MIVGVWISNHTDLRWNHVNSIDLNYGGALLFYGQRLYINASTFKKNGGLIGGAILINGLFYNQSFWIENSDFEDNFSHDGGAIAIDSKVICIVGTITKNSFRRNWAYSIFNFFFYANQLSLSGGKFPNEDLLIHD